MPLTVHEPILQYEFESELLRASPRRLRYTFPSALMIAACVLSYVAVMAGVVGIGVRSAQMIWLARGGRTVVARIVSYGYVRDERSAELFGMAPPPARVRYGFSYSGQMREGWAPAAAAYDAAAYPPARYSHGPTHLSRAVLPTRIPIRFGTIGGRLIYSPAAEVSEHEPVTSIFLALLVGWIASYCFVLWRAWFLRVVRLLRTGDPAVGTVIDKEIADADTSRYYVTYGFVDADGQDRTHRERCTPQQWRRLQIGQEVTILCATRGRQRYAIYRHLPLKCR